MVDYAEGAALHEAIEAALQRLPPTWREAFGLREIEGLGYEEIAERLEISPGTARNWVSKAKADLRDLLGPEFRPDS